jgi:hypothetical protein
MRIRFSAPLKSQTVKVRLTIPIFLSFLHVRAACTPTSHGVWGNLRTVALQPGGEFAVVIPLQEDAYAQCLDDKVENRPTREFNHLCGCSLHSCSLLNSCLFCFQAAKYVQRFYVLSAEAVAAPAAPAAVRPARALVSSSLVTAEVVTRESDLDTESERLVAMLETKRKGNIELKRQMDQYDALVVANRDSVEIAKKESSRLANEHAVYVSQARNMQVGFGVKLLYNSAITIFHLRLRWAVWRPNNRTHHLCPLLIERV